MNMRQITLAQYIKESGTALETQRLYFSSKIQINVNEVTKFLFINVK